MSENCWCTAVTSARRDAAGEATPDCLRAAARTYRRAFSTAASAMPRSGVVARSTRPGLQVPRSPSVFQSPVRSSVTSADDEHLVARRAIGGAPRGREDRVGVVAVGDHGAFLTSDTARRTAPPRTCCAGRRPRCPVPSSPMPAGTDRRPRHAGRRRHRRHPDAVRARGSGSGASRTPSPSRRSDARGSWRSCTVREASRFATQSGGNGTREQPLVPERVDRFVRTRASRSTSTAQRAATSATTLSARAAGPHDCADSIPVPLARAILMPLRVRRVRPEWNPHSRTCSCAEARRENRCRTNPPAPA